MNIPKLGDIVAGRYELTGELGRGGFGVVFKATQIGMNRPVALKVLLPQAASEETMVERFVREAQLAKNLVHPNTIQLFDFGETDSGCLYIAMEYLEGETLDHLIKRQGQLPMDRAIHIAAQILKSLAEAHEHGIVHRDLKPANIFMRELVGEKDFVKVLDFGIAKALNLDGAEEEQQLTKTGSSFGTPSYMSPEQIRGTQIGPHTDIYALGLILIKMLTGATAIEGGTPIETAAMQLSSHPVPLPEPVLHSPLGPIMQRALAKRVEDRYRQAIDMLHDLQQISGAARSGVMTVVPAGNTGVLYGNQGTGPTPPSGQLVYSGQFDYNQLSGPVPMPGGAPQQRSAVVPMLVVVILLLLVGGAAGVYFLVLRPGADEGQAQAQSSPDKDKAETTKQVEPSGSPTDSLAQAQEDISKLTAEIDAQLPEPVEEEPVVMVEFAVSSEPAGIVVKEGDKLLGVTPFSAAFPEGSGEHTLTFSGPGYEPSQVVVDAASPAPVAVKLERTDGGTTAAAANTKSKDETSSSSRRRRDRDRDKNSGSSGTKDTDKADSNKKDEPKKDEPKKDDTKTRPSIPLPD